MNTMSNTARSLTLVLSRPPEQGEACRSPHAPRFNASTLQRFARSAFLLFVSFVSFVVPAPAQPIHFYARPYRVSEGDAVLFLYREDLSSIKRTNIVSFKWDYDNDGAWDFTGTTNSLNQTWYATYKTTGTQTVQGIFMPWPKLQVTYQTPGATNLITTNIVGMTEDLYGDTNVEHRLLVTKRATANQDIELNLSASFRLLAANATNVIRFTAEVNWLKPGEVVSEEWFFNVPTTGPPSTNVDSPSELSTVGWPFPAAGEYAVALRVNYLTNGSDTVLSLTKSNAAFIKVLPANAATAELSLGRAYRRGFPEEYGWDDIVKAYDVADEYDEHYVYFRHLVNAYLDWLGHLPTNAAPSTSDLQTLAETVNEVLQGQTLLGSQRLIEALRIKYPRMQDFDPANPPERLPVPPGAREQTAAIDVALLDFHTALSTVAEMIHANGLSALRSRAPQGNEPYPDFPRYLQFSDVTLSPFPIPAKNEYWQLTTCFDQLALGTVEKAKKLFRYSVQDASARQEAKEECKKAGLQGYLGMALLAAGQTTNDFALNQGNSLLAHLKNSRDLFNQINAGLNPLGNDGSFIPNESFAAIYQDAQESVSDARETEINARQEDRTYDHNQADLRNEQLSQRNSYITPLKLLTGIDPALYNNLQTVDNQLAYRAAVRSRVATLQASYPNVSASGYGEYGAQVISILDAQAAIQQAVNRLNNLYEGIAISKWAHTSVEMINDETAETISALEIAKGICDATAAYLSAPAGTPGFDTAKGWGIFLAKVASAKLSSVEEKERAIQRARIADVQFEAEVRKSLLDVANLGIDIRRAINAHDQQVLKLESMLTQMDRYIEDLAHTRDTAANLYFQDPSFRVVVSQAQKRADDELDYAVDRLYRLAKTLEYEWTEGYQNPLIIPVSSFEPASLENPLFDKFTALDSLFNLRSADEAKDYLDALKAWDSKLRRINVTSVRGPNHAGPYTAESISVREKILGMSTTGPDALTLNDSILKFRNWLQQQRTNTTASSPLQFTFATTIADNSMFPATGAEWNMRINSIRIDLVAESGFSSSQVAEIDLTMAGMATMRRFWAEPPLADDLFNLTFNPGRIDRSAFTIKVPARINGAMGGRPASEFEAMGLADRPIAATQWIFAIDTTKPSNTGIDFTKLKDIIIRFTYTYGNPPEFPGF